MARSRNRPWRRRGGRRRGRSSRTVPKCREALILLMRAGIFPRQVLINSVVVGRVWVAAIYSARVPPKLFYCCLAFFLAQLRARLRLAAIEPLNRYGLGRAPLLGRLSFKDFINLVGYLEGQSLAHRKFTSGAILAWLTQGRSVPGAARQRNY